MGNRVKMTHQSDTYIVHSPRHQGVQALVTLLSDSHRNLYFVNSANVSACLGFGPRVVVLSILANHRSVLQPHDPRLVAMT